MRAYTLAIALVFFPLPAGSQQQIVPPAPAQPQPPRLFASKADIDALIDNAKTARRPDQANFIQTIVREAPYTVNLEYRVASLDSPPSVHEHEAELFYVIDGAATLITGGKLRDERRTNAANLSGSAIDGGTPRHISKGDFILVPENTPHGFSNIDGTLVLASLHVPQAAK
jgi:mannose-6-phosphate isomerase-like protein (cupin superfamily)